MKERPILFSGPMVQAILDGRKTQTRRVVKPSAGLQSTWASVESLAKCPTNYLCEVDGDLGAQFQHPLAGQFAYGVQNDKYSPYGWFKCPYGKPGDRLWVRETAIIAPKRWNNGSDATHVDNDGDKRIVQYLATQPSREAADDYGLKATPSIFMPRWASRITLEITGVRVERLQEISETDAKAEGKESIDELKRSWNSLYKGQPEKQWIESQNGQTSPWVWVVGFKKI